MSQYDLCAPPPPNGQQMPTSINRSGHLWATRAHLGLKLRTITVKNNKYYRSIYNRAAEAWNKLDLNVRNIRDRDT